ncbi:YqaE/Pmp3 family membrane protein [uncultured Pontibacter sp.]|uniref:YqaE/Pmp3 family membrane protein n=1 Tax=uncultured Pontibacter sp. TaxID=453356 RepID=UPI0026315E83|nr:YqaE/Pmp3 family membrane protein [uncultured Pontibacter sp.]
MKIRSLLNLVFVLIAAQLMFACSSTKYYEFAGHKQAPYNDMKKPAAEKAVAPEISLSEVALAAAEEKATEKEAEEPVLEASVAVSAKPAAPAPKVAPIAPVAVEEVTITEAEAMAMAKERLASMTKAEKKEFKKEVREALMQDRSGSGVSIIKIILAVLLPPLAVFLHVGIGTQFWISLILTLLFWIPGVIYALLVVTDTI